MELQKIRKEKKYTPEICPEVMGKINVFGSPEEVSRLVTDTGCSFCIDFAHLLAREGKVDFVNVLKLFPGKKWHCHFSGIEYGEKGEKRHKLTKGEYWTWLFEHLPKDKDITIINESPDPVGDSVAGLKIYGKK